MSIAWVAKSYTVRLRARRGPLKALVGAWYVFHYSHREGGDLFRREVWKIDLSKRGVWRITTRDDEREGLAYSGVLRAVEPGHLVCELQGKGHKEVWHVRLLYPIPVGKQQDTWGLLVGEDFDHNIFATMLYLSKEDSSIPEARRLVANKLSSCRDPKTGSLVLRAGPSAGGWPWKRRWWGYLRSED